MFSDNRVLNVLYKSYFKLNDFSAKIVSKLRTFTLIIKKDST